MSRILDRSGTTGQALDYAPYSGLMRMKARGLLVLFDAMPPAPSGRDMRGHAGALSFELADGGARIVTNIGPVPEGAKILAPDMAALVRTTAAHSTLVADNRNSTELRDGVLGDGVNSIEISRSQSADGLSISARHDGYRRRLKLDHRRSLTMSARGDKLEGCDELLPQGRIPRGGIDFDLRFHLHPRITASVTQGGSAVLLRLSDRHGWLFRLKVAVPNWKTASICRKRYRFKASRLLSRARCGAMKRARFCGNLNAWGPQSPSRNHQTMPMFRNRQEKNPYHERYHPYSPRTYFCIG